MGATRFQPGACCGCSQSLCVTACGGIPLVGASVTIQATSTGPALFSGTTGPTGCVKLNGVGAGSFYVTVTYGGSVVFQNTLTLSSGTTNLGVSQGVVCCGAYVIPYNLTLTDAAGPISLVYDSTDGLYVPTWFGGHAVTRPSSTVTTPNNICTAQPPTYGPVRVCYQMTCNAGQSPTFNVTRSWSWVYQQGTDPIWFQDPTGFSPGQYCITAPPAMCGNPLTDTASCGADPSAGGGFALSCTPAPAAGNSTSDPIGGTVAVSD
jgi:hypothetical protein